jgi:hypothetical protein
MQISDGWMGHWRVWCRRTGPLPVLRCWVSADFGALDAGAESGENLDAQTWENDRYRVTIGTEDSEALAARAGRTLPADWQAPLQRFFVGPIREGFAYPVRYDADGLALVLPEAPTRELCEFHHAVAWQQVGVGDEVSTWFAVDLMRQALPPALRT